MDSARIKAIEEREREKYTELFTRNYGSTGYQTQFSEVAEWITPEQDRILDMGCGCGVAVKRLLLKKRDAVGVDITLAGCATKFLPRQEDPIWIPIDPDHFKKAPLWRMPFVDRAFHTSMSSDVMEHLPPEMLDATIKEMFRVTRDRMVHVVSTQESKWEKGLHLVVKPMWWWRKKFEKYNSRGIWCMIVTAQEFLGYHGELKHIMKGVMRESKPTNRRGNPHVAPSRKAQGVRGITAKRKLRKRKSVHSLHGPE